MKSFIIRAEENRLKKIQERAKKENLSANKYILKTIEEAPNLVTGNWWDNPNTIRKFARELKREMRR